jgi:hypothetical protein
MATTYTMQETMKLIADIAKEKGDDFRLTVRKRNPQDGSPMSCAIFVGVGIEQIATPEIWLRDLAGGGEYWLQVTHSTDAFNLIGSILTHRISGAPMPVNAQAPTMPDWRGPTNVNWIEGNTPPVKPAEPQTTQQQIAAAIAGIPAPPPLSHTSTPLQATAAEAVRVAEDRERNLMFRGDLSRTEAELKAQAATLAAREREIERENVRVRAEADKAVTEAKAAAERQIAMLTAMQPRSQPLGEILAPLVTAVAPLIVGYLQTQQQRVAEEAKARMAVEIAIADREAKREERAEKAAQAQAELFARMSSESRTATEKLIEEMRRSFEKLSDKPGADVQTKEMFGSMSSAFAQLAQTTMSMVAAATELRPPEGPPQIDWGQTIAQVTRSAADAFKSYVGAQQRGAGLTPSGAAAALPPGAAPAQPQVEGEIATPAAPDDSEPIFNQIVLRVKAQEDPVQIAAFFLNSYDANLWFAYKVKKAATLIDLFGPLLADWVMENAPARGAYLDACGKAIDAEAERRRVAEVSRATRATQNIAAA